MADLVEELAKAMYEADPLYLTYVDEKRGMATWEELAEEEPFAREEIMAYAKAALEWMEKAMTTQNAMMERRSAEEMAKLRAERDELDRQARVIARPYVLEEREACAKLVEDMIIGREEKGRTGQALAEAARKIRRRG